MGDGQLTFLHILPSDTIRTYRVIELIVANFDITAHRFIITEDEKHVATHYPLLLEFKLPNIMFLKRPQKNRFLEKMAIIRSIGNQMKDADVIVWHSFFPFKGLLGFPMLLLCAKKSNLKKSVWLEHSTDLLYWSDPSANSLKGRLKNHLQKYIRDNISYVGTTLPSDKAIHSSSFAGTYKYFELPTPIPESHFSVMQETIKEREDRDNKRLKDMIDYNIHEELERFRVVIEERRQLDKEIKEEKLRLKEEAEEEWLRLEEEARQKEKKVHTTFSKVSVWKDKNTINGERYLEFTREANRTLLSDNQFVGINVIIDTLHSIEFWLNGTEDREAAKQEDRLLYQASVEDVKNAVNIIVDIENWLINPQNYTKETDNLLQYRQILEDARIEHAKGSAIFNLNIKEDIAPNQSVMVAEEQAPYTSYEDLVDKVTKSTVLPPHKPNILLGYDGLGYNGHKSLIDKLGLLKGHRDDIGELYIPMNYTMKNEYDIPSSDAYRRSVSDYGVKVLGFRPRLLNNGNLTEKEYFEFLDSIDIAVFGGHRPLNVDMLLYLLYMGKKIFLPSGIYLTKFLKENYCMVEENDSLLSMRIEEFIKQPVKTDRKSNAIYSYLDRDFVISKWQAFFDYFKDKSHKDIARNKMHIKYLYLFFGTQRTMGGYWKMIGERSDFNDHKFMIPRTTAIIKWVPELAYRDDIIYLPNKNLLGKLRYIHNIYSHSDNIIIHGMFVSTFMYIPLILFRKFRNRLAWIEWTGDIWIWKKAETCLKNKIINKINYRLREIMPYIVMTAPTDEERFKSEFTKSTAKCVYIPLPSKRATSPVIGIEEARPKTSKSPDAPIRIQVAHNVFNFNRHIEIMKMLERFKNNNIELFLPLAYGEGGLNGEHGGWDYINTVKSYAKLNFGEKAILHTKTVSLEDYTKLLWQVDIAIFGSERMAGAANIYMLLYMGKKVYIPGGCAYYNFFKSKGLQVFDMYQIPNMSYEEFIQPVENQDVSWIAEQYDQKKTASLWNDFFIDLDARHSEKR